MDFQSNEPFDMGETGLFEENHGFSFSPVPNTASHGSQNDAFVPANPATFKPTQSRDRAFYPDFGSQTSVKPANRQTQESRRSQPAREEMRTRAPALHNLKESLNCIRPLSGLESRVSTVETQMTRIADQIRQMKAALARTNEATTKVETLLKEREEDVSQVLEVAQTISMMIQRIGGQGDSVSE